MKAGGLWQFAAQIGYCGAHEQSKVAAPSNYLVVNRTHLRRCDGIHVLLPDLIVRTTLAQTELVSIKLPGSPGVTPAALALLGLPRVPGRAGVAAVAHNGLDAGAYRDGERHSAGVAVVGEKAIGPGPPHHTIRQAVFAEET